MSECIFCEIAQGKKTCYKIYEDDSFLAFLDVLPYCEGHTLVIPKKHYPQVYDVENIGDYFAVCQKIARHYLRVLNISFLVTLTLGRLIPHAHIHLLPDIDGSLGRVFNRELTQLRQPQITQETGKSLTKKLKLT